MILPQEEWFMLTKFSEDGYITQNIYLLIHTENIMAK